MSQDPLFIRKHEQLPPHLDYQALRREFIDWAQRLSGAVWTDYNAHDPGVTTIEQLCYALIELGYKIEADFEQLFFAGVSGQDPDQFGLFPPHRVFFSAPVTIDDYRRLLIDRYEEVRNAWLTVDHNTKKFQVWIHAQENARKEQLKKEVGKTLHQNRNLGEDFADPVILKEQKIWITGTLEFSPEVDRSEAFSSLLLELEHYLHPPIRLYDLETVPQRDDLLQGPRPENGFILPEDLARTELGRKFGSSTQLDTHLQEKVKGLTIKDLTIEYVDSEQELDPSAPIVDIKRETVLVWDMEKIIGSFLNDDNAAKQVRSQLKEKQASYKYRPSKLDFTQSDQFAYRPTSSLLQEDILKFVSLQETFPSLYENAPDLKKEERLQFQGYLLLFEQLMADFLVKLAGFRDLLDVSGKGNADLFASYWSILEGIKGFETLVVEKKKGELKKIYEQHFLSVDQQGKLVDFLLAALGEDIDEELIRKIRGERFDETQWLEDRKALLKNFPEFSYARGLGVDKLSDGVSSSLEDKLAILIGIGGAYQKLFLIEENLVSGQSKGLVYMVILDPDDTQFTGKENYLLELLDSQLPAIIKPSIVVVGKGKVKKFQSDYKKWRKGLLKKASFNLIEPHLKLEEGTSDHKEEE